MRGHTRELLKMATAGVLLAIHGTAAGFEISKNGVVDFSDNFNTSPQGNDTLNSRPVADVGAYTSITGNNIFVGNSFTTPAGQVVTPKEGNAYLNFAHQAGTGGQMSLNLDNPVTAPGDVFRLQTWAYVPFEAVHAGTTPYQLVMFNNDGSGVSNYTINAVFVTPQNALNPDDTRINIQPSDSAAIHPSNVWIEPDKWQLWDISYTVGASTFSWLVDGVGDTNLTLMSQRATGAIKEVRFFANGESADNPVFFDAVNTTVLVPTWKTNGAGDWHSGTNWTSAIPNAPDAEARFFGVITSPRTVYTDTPVTVGTIRFNNSNSYLLAGNGTLTVQVTTGSGVVDVQSGTHKINLPLVFASNTNLNVAAGATLKISDPVTVNAGTQVTQTPGGGDVLYESTVTVGTAASIQFGNSSHMASLTVGEDASAEVTPGLTKVLRVDSVNIGPEGKLDLKDNKLITNTPVGNWDGTKYTGIQGEVSRAYDFGAWDLPGIMTSMPDAGPTVGKATIGVATGEQALFLAPTETGVFAGQTITGATTIAMYTWAGDVDLNGYVDAVDYGTIDQWIQFPGTTGYTNGDLNYDGVIDAVDYGIIDNGIQLQGAPIPINGGAATGGLTAVPEPASLSALALGFGMMLRRQRRR